MSGLTGGKNIERLINSSLDDIVREERRERQARKAAQAQSKGKSGKRGEKRPNSVNSNARGHFKGSPQNRPSKSRARSGRKDLVREREKERGLSKDKVRSIQIVAKLDDIPTPTAQQRAALSNLEVIPSSISSQKAGRGRVFG